MASRVFSNDWWRGITGRLLRRVSRLWARPDHLLTTLALIIGPVTALGALAFSWLIEVVTRFYFEHTGHYLAAHGLYYWLLPLLPMSGGLLVGLITYYYAPEAEGHGVPEVMDAMAREGGRIRPRVAGAKAVASSLTIGSGGAAGTEGPIIQIGAALGSGFGQWLHLSLEDMRVLIGCGTAAGIAAIFNAPIAGVLFAVEVLLRDVSLRSFVPVIVSSVLSTTVMQAFRGSDDPLFPVGRDFFGNAAEPIYQFTIPELGNYLILGLICGLVGVAFIKLLYGAEDVFRKLPVHRVARPVIGALLLGLLAVATEQMIAAHLPTGEATHQPAIMGNGYPLIIEALDEQAYGGPRGWAVHILLILLVAKTLATCLTLGSGGSGGVFAPSLCMGAAVGGAFGLLVQHVPLFHGISPGAYALVGMAAVVASSIHAPLTATLMLFELTRDYKVVLPIMMASVTALAVAQRIEPASIYTLKLLRRGVRFGSRDLRVLQQISVRDIRRLPAPAAGLHDPVDKLVRIMRTTTANDFVVLDDKGRVAGMVLGDDLRTMLLEAEAMPLLTVSDIMRSDVPTVNLDDTLDVVMHKFAGKPMQSLPVIDSSGAKGPRELITRAAVMNRYQQALADSVAVEPRGATSRQQA